MTICNRCGENKTAFALCTECEFRMITGSATFTAADLAAWEQMIEFEIDEMLLERHGM